MTGDHMRKSDELDSFIKVLETFLEQHESFATMNDDMVQTINAFIQRVRPNMSNLASIPSKTYARKLYYLGCSLFNLTKTYFLHTTVNGNEDMAFLTASNLQYLAAEIMTFITSSNELVRSHELLQLAMAFRNVAAAYSHLDNDGLSKSALEQAETFLRRATQCANTDWDDLRQSLIWEHGLFTRQAVKQLVKHGSLGSATLLYCNQMADVYHKEVLTAIQTAADDAYDCIAVRMKKVFCDIALLFHGWKDDADRLRSPEIEALTQHEAHRWIERASSLNTRQQSATSPLQMHILLISACIEAQEGRTQNALALCTQTVDAAEWSTSGNAKLMLPRLMLMSKCFFESGQPESADYCLMKAAEVSLPASVLQPSSPLMKPFILHKRHQAVINLLEKLKQLNTYPEKLLLTIECGSLLSMNMVELLNTRMRDVLANGDLTKDAAEAICEELKTGAQSAVPAESPEAAAIWILASEFDENDQHKLKSVLKAALIYCDNGMLESAEAALSCVSSLANSRNNPFLVMIEVIVKLRKKDSVGVSAVLEGVANQFNDFSGSGEALLCSPWELLHVATVDAINHGFRREAFQCIHSLFMLHADCGGGSVLLRQGLLAESVWNMLRILVDDSNFLLRTELYDIFEVSFRRADSVGLKSFFGDQGYPSIELGRAVLAVLWNAGIELLQEAQKDGSVQPDFLLCSRLFTQAFKWLWAFRAEWTTGDISSGQVAVLMAMMCRVEVSRKLDPSFPDSQAVFTETTTLFNGMLSLCDAFQQHQQTNVTIHCFLLEFEMCARRRDQVQLNGLIQKLQPFLASVVPDELIRVYARLVDVCYDLKVAQTITAPLCERALRVSSKFDTMSEETLDKCLRMACVLCIIRRPSPDKPELLTEFINSKSQQHDNAAFANSPHARKLVDLCFDTGMRIVQSSHDATESYMAKKRDLARLYLNLAVQLSVLSGVSEDEKNRMLHGFESSL